MRKSNSFNLNREVVFVKAKVGSSDNNVYKKFAMDPNITTFNIFLGLLAKCFDITTDFSVSYLVSDDYGEQFYLPMQSDWDLDAAILTSSEPALRVKLNVKSLASDLVDWDIIAPADVRYGLRRQLSLRASLPISYAAKRVGLHATTFLSAVSDRVGKTVSNVQKAIGFKADFEGDVHRWIRDPINDVEFRRYLDNVGRVTQLEQLCWDIFRGGLQPELRKVGWRLILSVFPTDMTGQERISLLESKTEQYLTMKSIWKNAYAQGRLTDQQLSTLASVSIDVVRTDWTHSYYVGEQNRYRVCQLFDLLATYCIYHPSIGYNQGMSDLASPLLITQQDEAAAYLCFCALMRRVRSNFCSTDPSGLIAKMHHLYTLLTHKDPKLACFLRMHGLADMYFTQRWLLLELKREFTFDDCLRLFEIQWAASNAIRLSIDSNTEQTSNSKSVGHLVLAENKTINLPDDHIMMNCEPHLLHRCGPRDVTLINSLIGSDYVFQLPNSQESQLKRFAFTDITRQTGIMSRFRAANLVSAHSVDFGSNCSSIFPSNDPLCKDTFNFLQNATEQTIALGEKTAISNDGNADRDTSIIRNPVQTSETYSSQWVSTTNAPLPGPDELGYGNPFLLFLCFSLLLEYREVIFTQVKDASDIVSLFQQRSKKHDTDRVLRRAQMYFIRYLQDNSVHLP